MSLVELGMIDLLQAIAKSDCGATTKACGLLTEKRLLGSEPTQKLVLQ